MTFQRHSSISTPSIEEQLELCAYLNISEEVFHSLNLQLWGVCIAGNENTFDSKNSEICKEIHLRLPSNEVNGQFSVPKKIPVMQKGLSPYIYDEGAIYYNASPIFNNSFVIEIPLPEKNTPRYLKGYSFPFLGTKFPYYELRINPRNTGRCPGRCLFCHRGYSHRFKPAQNRRILSPEEVVDIIVRNHGIEVFEHVSHISVITELFGNEDSFLLYIKKLKELLENAGCKSKRGFGVCGQDVRSEKGMRKLYEIVDEKRYSYTLEVFSKRTIVMSKYKAVSLEMVENILKRARDAGFFEIKINYIAGIDSIDAFEKGIRRLHRLGIVDSIGLSIFTAFFPDQLKLRNEEAWNIKYYLRVIELLKELKISFYKPNCFEMGFPLQLL